MIARAMKVIALLALTVMGLMAVGCSYAEPDLISGPGLIIDGDENPPEEIEAGYLAPDFHFQDAVGNSYSLSDFRGRLVVLNFWRSQCSHCVTEMPYIQQLYDQWPAEELVLLTITKDVPATVTTFMQDEGYSLPALVDEESIVSTQYQVSGLPRTFFINEDGYIVCLKRGGFQSYEEIEEILDQLLPD